MTPEIIFIHKLNQFFLTKLHFTNHEKRVFSYSVKSSLGLKHKFPDKYSFDIPFSTDLML